MRVRKVSFFQGTRFSKLLAKSAGHFKPLPLVTAPKELAQNGARRGRFLARFEGARRALCARKVADRAVTAGSGGYEYVGDFRHAGGLPHCYGCVGSLPAAPSTRVRYSAKGVTSNGIFSRGESRVSGRAFIS